MCRTIRVVTSLLLTLVALRPYPSLRAEPSPAPAPVTPIEIAIGKIGRYPLSSLLSREWFFIGDKELFIHAPSKTDLNQWLATLRGSLTVLAVPGPDYTFNASERGVRGEVVYSLAPADNTHDFFIGDSGIALVVADVGKDVSQFQRKKQLVDRLMPLVGKEVVLILRRR